MEVINTLEDELETPLEGFFSDLVEGLIHCNTCCESHSVFTRTSGHLGSL